MSIDQAYIKKILVINTKFLGDLIVSTPGIRSLRKAYPDAEIVILVRKDFEDVLANNPNINRILTFDPKLKGNSGLRNFFEGLKFIKNIRNEKFDVVIALHPGDRTAFWSWFSGAKIRIAPGKQSFRFLFTQKVDVEEDSISYLDYYNNIFTAFGIPIDSDKTEFFVPDEDQEWTWQFFTENQIWEEDIIIGIHPGASDSTKIWLYKNFTELIKLLAKNKTVRILLFEGPQDKQICDEIKKHINNETRLAHTTVGIIKTAALMKKCKLFITHDTGTRHLAVAMGTPVLALLPEDNLKSWNFYDESSFHYSIVGKRYIPPQNSNGVAFLNGISVESVYNKIGNILNLW